MKQYGFAINQVKLQRAIAAAKGDESKVYDLYVGLGGKVQKGYEKEEVVLSVEEPIHEILTEEIIEELKELASEEETIIEGEGTVDEEGNVESTITKVEVKKRGRPSRNAK